MERTRSDETTSLVLAPVHAVGDDTDSIYEYIKREQALRDDYERSRLLYVAVTRAKKHLDLFFTLKEGKKIPSGSLLEKLWPSIQNSLSITEQSIKSEPDNLISTYTPVNLRRLPVSWVNPINQNRLADQIAWHNQKFGFLLPDHTPKLIGILVHQILQQISHFDFDWWQMQSNSNKFSYLKTHLLRLGANKQQLDTIIESINQQVNAMLDDPRGRWILSKQQEAQSEFRLTAMVDSQPKQFIIDRTFVDENNIRWIIDYKTSVQASDETLALFLQNEKTKYQKQMWYYFQAIREMDHRPVRMGLYFPAVPGWHEWDFEKEEII
jgi:ATP-dependent exoDNAse (exonuclease V) beta subunit